MSRQQREAKGVILSGRTDGRKTSSAGRCEQPALNETAECGRRAFCFPARRRLAHRPGGCEVRSRERNGVHL